MWQSAGVELKHTAEFSGLEVIGWPLKKKNLCVYGFDWPLVYLNVSCWIFCLAVLEKCTENGQWPPALGINILHIKINVVPAIPIDLLIYFNFVGGYSGQNSLWHMYIIGSETRSRSYFLMEMWPSS